MQAIVTGRGRTPTPPGMDDIQLLAKSIEASELAARQFAMVVLLRDERTIRRWQAGDVPMPEIVREFLATCARARAGDRDAKKNLLEMVQALKSLGGIR